MTYELAIAILAGLSVVTFGGAVIMARSARRAPLTARLRELEVGEPDPQAASGKSLVEVLDRVGSAVSSGKHSTSLKEQLTQAGFFGRTAPAIYIGVKIILFLSGLPLLTVPLMLVDIPYLSRITLILTGCAVFFFLPNFYVQFAKSKRSTDVRTNLPNAIDLLEICVSAGMGLDMAWNAVTDEVRNVSPTLADEMALTDLEIHLGASRAIAMRHMAQRTGSDDLASLVAILVQSDRFGTSIAEALRTFATSMREARSQRAQEYAEKMAVKLIFPMVLFIFPAVVIVMAGPAVLRLKEALSQ